MPSPNDRQVAGDHYRATYQHWDFVEDVNLGYLEAQATRYVARWRKKNGHEDLRKADHYLEKLQHADRPNRVNWLKVTDALHRFIIENKLEMSDAILVREIVLWDCSTDLYLARAMIAELLEKRHDDGTPVTDSNRHSR